MKFTFQMGDKVSVLECAAIQGEQIPGANRMAARKAVASAPSVVKVARDFDQRAQEAFLFAQKLMSHETMLPLVSVDKSFSKDLLPQAAVARLLSQKAMTMNDQLQEVVADVLRQLPRRTEQEASAKKLTQDVYCEVAT